MTRLLAFHLSVFAAACAPTSAPYDARAQRDGDTFDASSDDVAQANTDATPPPVDVDVVSDAGCCRPRPGRTNTECRNFDMGICISHLEGSACEWSCDGGR